MLTWVLSCRLRHHTAWLDAKGRDLLCARMVERRRCEVGALTKLEDEAELLHPLSEATDGGEYEARRAGRVTVVHDEPRTAAGTSECLMQLDDCLVNEHTERGRGAKYTGYPAVLCIIQYFYNTLYNTACIMGPKSAKYTPTNSHKTNGHAVNARKDPFGLSLSGHRHLVHVIVSYSSRCSPRFAEKSPPPAEAALLLK